MPSITFVASYNIAKIFGAKVYLSDVDKFTGQMSPEHVIECCTKFNLKKVKIIVTMYNGGYPNDAFKFKSLKKRYNAFIVEDSCHAFGASYYNKKKKYMVGSCSHSDLATFSFHPVKTITTGEGGLVTTNHKKFYIKIKKLRSLGILRSKKNHWEYDVINNGLNFRLTDFQCALGISQLMKINKFIAYRKKIFVNYNKGLKNIKYLQIPKIQKNTDPSYHLYIININSKEKNVKNRFIKFMLKNKILVQQHYIPLYKFKNFKDKFVRSNSEKYFKSAVSLPIYYKLNYSEQLKVIKLIKSFFKSL